MKLASWVLASAAINLPAVAAPADAFFPLNQAIALLADSPHSAHMSGELAGLRQFAQKLEDRFAAAGAEVPDDYAKTLVFHAGLLRQASQGRGPAPTGEIVTQVVEDLRIKDVASSLNGMGLGVGPISALVNVKVSTTRNGVAVHGLLVRCNPRRFADAAAPMFVFNAPSSPTAYRMPPGMYVCTAAQSGTVMARQDVSVGLGGAAHEDVTMPLQ